MPGLSRTELFTLNGIREYLGSLSTLAEGKNKTSTTRWSQLCMTKTLKKELRTCQELESSSSGYPNIGEVTNLNLRVHSILIKKEADFTIKATVL